jgi:DNA processing protein
VARRLAAGLAETGIAIVSGLARGIDSAAHRGALEVGGTTVAVLATGLDRIYPPENLSLADSIVAMGALVTEMPEQTVPLPRRFPIRNRLISGLSHGVIVVEAAERSGALITARMALEQGREVLAVPGSVDNPLTVGTHRLLKDGATLVHTVEDVLQEFPGLVCAPVRTRAHARTREGPQEPELFAVWELLDWVEPRHHDDLAAQLKLDVQEVSRRLTLLEMGNYIIGDCGGVVRRPAG